MGSEMCIRDSCSTVIDKCNSISYCDATVGECKLTWWFILIIVLIVLLIVGVLCCEWCKACERHSRKKYEATYAGAMMMIADGRLTKDKPAGGFMLGTLHPDGTMEVGGKLNKLEADIDGKFIWKET